MDTKDLKNSALYKVFLEDLDLEIGRAESARLAGTELNPDKLNRLGVAFHKLKGSAGIMGFAELAGAAAAIENLVRKDPRPAAEKSAEFEKLLTAFKRMRIELPEI